MSVFSSPNAFFFYSFYIWVEAVINSLNEFYAAYCNEHFRNIILRRNIKRCELYGWFFSDEEQQQCLNYGTNYLQQLGKKIKYNANPDILSHLDACEDMIDQYLAVRRRFRFGFEGKVTIGDFAKMLLDAYVAGQDPIRITVAPLMTGQILTKENMAVFKVFLYENGVPEGTFRYSMYLGDETKIMKFEDTDITYNITEEAERRRKGIPEDNVSNHYQFQSSFNRSLPNQYTDAYLADEQITSVGRENTDSRIAVRTNQEQDSSIRENEGHPNEFYKPHADTHLSRELIEQEIIQLLKVGSVTQSLEICKATLSLTEDEAMVFVSGIARTNGLTDIVAHHRRNERKKMIGSAVAIMGFALGWYISKWWISLAIAILLFTITTYIIEQVSSKMETQ